MFVRVVTSILGLRQHRTHSLPLNAFSVSISTLFACCIPTFLVIYITVYNGCYTRGLHVWVRTSAFFVTVRAGTAYRKI